MANNDGWSDDQERNRYRDDDDRRMWRERDPFHGRSNDRREASESRWNEFGSRRAYGRGTDYEGDGTIARRGFGNESAGYDRGRDDHRSYGSSQNTAWRDYGSRSDRGLQRDTFSGSTFGGRQSNDRDEAWGYPSEGTHRGRGPKGYTRSDERIHEDICERLTHDPWVDASEIEVNVSGREVTLSGMVDSREAKRRAEDCAERVSGVTHVQNNLRVQHGMASGSETSHRMGASDRSGNITGTAVEVNRTEPGSRFAAGSKT
jgi:osmotically-inducible protein OsmY